MEGLLSTGPTPSSSLMILVISGMLQSVKQAIRTTIAFFLVGQLVWIETAKGPNCILASFGMVFFSLVFVCSHEADQRDLMVNILAKLVSIKLIILKKITS